MGNVKSFILKTLLLLVILAAIVVLVGYLLIHQATASISGNMMEAVRFSARSASAIANVQIGENLGLVNSTGVLDETYFSGRATLDKNRTLTFDLNGEKIHTHTIRSTEVMRRLREDRLNAFTINEVLELHPGDELYDEAEEMYFIYSKKSPISDDNNLLIQRTSQFVAQLARNGADSLFDAYAVCRQSNVILTTNRAVLAEKSDLGGSITDTMQTPTGALTEAISFKAGIGGVTYLIGIDRLPALKSGGIEYYFLGLNDFGTVQSSLDAYMHDVIFVLAFCAAAICLLCVGYGLLILRRRKQSFGNSDAIRVAAEEAYPLTVDKNGAVTETNSDFDRKFSLKNVAENVVYNSFHGALKQGDTFLVVAKDHKGSKHLINFAVTKPLGKGKERTGYRLTGSDVTDLVDTLTGAMNLEIQGDDEDAFKATYEKMLWAHKKMLVGRIRFTNLTNLQVMFGKHFSDAMFSVLTDKAAGLFDAVFPRRSDDSIGVLITEAQDFNVRAEDLSKELGELNKPVNVEENLVSVACVAGFDLVERGVGDNKYDYVERCIGAAMKRAVADEHRNFYVYRDFQKKQFVKYMDRDYDIKKMLEEDSFEMQFQPQYSVKEKRVAGFEALFRFKKNVAMDIDTFEFIQYAERTGNIILLGNFIFDSAMKFAKTLEGKGVTVSLNVSPVQLMQVGFVENLLRIYRGYDLQPGSVCVEITESFLMTTFDETLMKLDLLINAGINIHLDDFGTVYSSFLYLKKLPISAIKIDKEFIKDLCTSDYSREITQMVINIAKQLGKESIAEGVETEEQKKLLAKMGCDTLQGFLIGKSMPEKEAIALL